MRSVALFIAMSLDGYIADTNGGVAWLEGQEAAGEDGEDAYAQFIKDVDTVVMGRKTYDQIITELSPKQWPYDGLLCYVITHKKESSTEEIHFTGEDPCALIRRLLREEGKTIWICGGASIVQSLLREDLVDQFSISVVPIILGGGIRLFEDVGKEARLRFVKSEGRGGILTLTYKRQT